MTTFFGVAFVGFSSFFAIMLEIGITTLFRFCIEFGAMGFKGQFITVLPKERAVVVMTGILATDASDSH